MAETSGTLGVTACLYREAGVFLSRERAGVTVETTGLPPGDGKATFFLLLRAAMVTSSSRTTGEGSSLWPQSMIVSCQFPLHEA